jgi:single-stranded-DNA-specific exonuclease
MSEALPAPTLISRGDSGAGEAGRPQAEALGVSTDLVDLMHRRGVQTEVAQRKLLDPRLSNLRKPDLMAGFEEAIELILTARANRWRVGVFGDYDVDGVTTAATLSLFLEEVGLEVVCKVATRSAGYGFTVEAAKALHDAGVRLVLTGDCGTSDHEALEWLRSRDVPCVVIDHHQVPETMPPAAALINPHQPACQFPFKGLCSAGVAFYLAAALRTKIREREPGAKLPDPRAWLDLAAVGTVCDMVPLVDENRILVRQGLALLDERRRPGLRALLQRANVGHEETLDEEHIGFRIGPRLNAPGRLDTAEPSLRLLRARGLLEAEPVAAEIETHNARRRSHQETIVDEAAKALATDKRTKNRSGIVVAGEGWLPGIVGIAASGIVERYQRPTLVLAIDRATGEARGSARSIRGVDVRAALAECRDLLERFGGHKQAAGVSMRAEHVPALVEAFDQAVAKQLDAAGITTFGIDYDGELSLERVDVDFVSALRSLGPFGVGFPRPLYHCEDATVVRARVIKDKHLSLRVRQAGREIDAIAYRQAVQGVQEGDRVGLLFEPTFSVFRGRQSVELLVERVWRHGIA